MNDPTHRQIIMRVYDSIKNALRVTLVQSDPVIVTDDIEWDEIVTTYPSSTQEVYTYKLLTNVVQIITVNYTNSSKELISSVIKV